MNRLLSAFLILFPLLACQAASVRMLTGENYQGKAEFNPDGITITPDQGAPVKVDIANVQDAVFDPGPTYSPGTIPPGILLVNGSFFARKVNERDYNGPTVKIGSADIPVPSTAIAQVLFLDVDLDKLRPQSGGGTGAMLNNGDFFAGAVDGIRDDRLQVNSLVLGPQRLIPGRQISGWVLRDVQPVTAAYEVISRDGSHYLTNDVKFDHDGVSLTDSIAGAVRVKTDDLSEVRAGAGRFRALTDSAPVRVDPPQGGNAANAYKLLPADPITREPAAVLTTANAMVTYVLPPGFGILAGSVALPKDAPAAAHLAFDVYADGRLIFGSPIVAAGASPQAIRINLGSARLITLRAEPSGPGSNGATGKWIAPILLHP